MCKTCVYCFSRWRLFVFLWLSLKLRQLDIMSNLSPRGWAWKFVHGFLAQMFLVTNRNSLSLLLSCFYLHVNSGSCNSWRSSNCCLLIKPPKMHKYTERLQTFVYLRTWQKHGELSCQLRMAFWCQGKISGTRTDLLTTFKIHGQRKYVTSVNSHTETEPKNRAVYTRLIESKMINLPSPDIGIVLSRSNLLALKPRWSIRSVSTTCHLMVAQRTFSYSHVLMFVTCELQYTWIYKYIPDMASIRCSAWLLPTTSCKILVLQCEYIH